MKRTLLIAILLSGPVIAIFASRPTIHAYGLKVTNITCHSMQVNWISGNGAARLIVASEGTAPTWIPVDGTGYSANPNFGKGTPMTGTSGGDNFIVYNGGGNNYVVVDSLKMGKTYYFIIYEHDNAGANTLYYTGGTVPMVYDSTYMQKLSFSVTTTDSCEAHNLFTFTNTSKSTIPGITYTFDFGDGNTSTSSPVNHQYVNKSGKLEITLTTSPSLGCSNTYKKTVNVYPKKVAYIDFTKFDTTQCFYGNYFEIDPTALITPLPKSFTYYWNYGDSTQISTFKKMKKSYTRKGRYTVVLEIRTNVNLTPTSCSDTIEFTIFVPTPSCKTSIKDSVQCFTNNLFSYVNSDASSQNYKWYFGDGDSAAAMNSQHSYKNAGTYFARHKVSDDYGCNKEDTLKVEVINSLNSDFNGLDTAYCSSNNQVTLTPLYPGGKFSGYPVTGYILTPNTPGNYTLSYKTSLVNCNYTVSKNFRIKASPVVELGNDTLITNSQNITLDAGPASTYLWSTSATTRTLFIDGQTTPKGSTSYSVIVTNNEGCAGSDNIVVSVDYKTLLNDTQHGILQVYPNPVNDMLTISNPGKIGFEWVIINESGQTIKSGNQGTQEIDFSDISKGVYFLEVKTSTGNHFHKLIKL